MRKWFASFTAGGFSLKFQERSDRPSTTDEDQIKILIENNPRYTTRKLGEMLNMSKSTIREHFVKLGYINRLDVLVPHELKVVTRDEKWIIYINVERKRYCGKRNDT